MRGGRTNDADALTSSPTTLRALGGAGIPSPAQLAMVTSLALVGVAGAILLMTNVPYRGEADLRAMVDDMKDTSQWLAWVLVLAVQTATWIGLAPAMLAVARESTGPWKRTQTTHLVALVAVVAAPVLGMELFGPSHPVQALLRGRMTVLTVIGVVVAMPGLIALVRTQTEIEALDKESETSIDERTLVTWYTRLRGRLHFVGGALAVIVALAVLATGGQRNTVVAAETARATSAEAAAGVLKEDVGANVDPFDCPREREATVAGGFRTSPQPTKADCLAAAAEAKRRATRFGVETVWSFGLYLTFALMLMYLPSYLSLLAVGRRIRDRKYPAPLPNDPNAESATKAREAFTKLLELEKSPLETLKPVALVLVPLVSSFASTLLGGVKVGG